MLTLCQYHAADWMIDAAENLHRLRGKPDLVADRLALSGTQQRDKLVLDVVGIAHRIEAITVESLELRACPVRVEQRLCGAAGGGFLHYGSPFFGDHNAAS